jgi:hypothetical protein
MTVEELQTEFLKFILPRFQWNGVAAMICHDPKVVIENGLKEIVAAAEARGFEKGRAEGAEQANERIKAWLRDLDNPALERVILPMRAYYRFNVDVDTLIEFIDALSPAPKEEK